MPACNAKTVALILSSPAHCKEETGNGLNIQLAAAAGIGGSRERSEMRMSDKPRICQFCVWLSAGFGDDERGSGYCYSNEDFRDNDDTCPFWQESLRDEPLEGPEAQLLQNVKAHDLEVED